MRVQKQVATWRGRGRTSCKWLALLLMLYGATSLASGQGTGSTAELPAIDGEELQALTPSQQQARQLATVLIGNREGGTVVQQKTLLQHLDPQRLRLGARGVVVIINNAQAQMQLLGGRQVLTSVMDDGPLAAAEDAQRPLFLPPSSGMIGMEIIAK